MRTLFVRHRLFGLVVIIFGIASLTLYISLDTSTTKHREVYERGKEQLGELETRLRDLESELRENDALISQIRKSMYNIVQGNDGVKKSIPAVSSNPMAAPLPNRGARPFAKNRNDTCYFSVSTRGDPQTDLQMLSVYQELDFKDVDGGAWKQGWDITYDRKAMETEEPQLQIIVVPHSHTDPGWIMTFERYYRTETKLILDSMLTYLSSNPTMRFMYAEMSFFERWWQDLTDTQRAAVRELLKKGQLEIVTGAWVMTDEANSHFYNTIDQMIEGHEFLTKHVLPDYKPHNHWANDPFGLSPTMPYLLRLANFTTMTVQRVHYSIKKHLAKTKQLEFNWRPLWSERIGNAASKFDSFTHLLPFYSYDVPHTCGPEPAVCCQFDFARLKHFGCPWKSPPVEINKHNVEQRAELLLDQYRKHAQLYATNVLLIMLGDDFRYQGEDEWHDQHTNYDRLFEYINSKKELNVHGRFGTLEDYFSELAKTKKPYDFPVLSGDFFTYADRLDHYWSGYYTSRPLHKRMDRVLRRYLHGAELSFAFGLAAAARDKITSYRMDELFTDLVEARRAVALFQHHDGVTGTAKNHVMEDYAQRMLTAMQACARIIAANAHLLMLGAKKNFVANLETQLFDINDDALLDLLSSETVEMRDGAKRKILLYNSLPYVRTELVCVYVSSYTVKLVDHSSQPVDLQITPVLQLGESGDVSLRKDRYSACFVAHVPSVGFNVYTLTSVNNLKEFTSSVVSTMKSNRHQKIFTDQLGSELQVETLSNGDISAVKGASFAGKFDSKTGYLKEIALLTQQGLGTEINLEFVKYGSRKAKETSGCYIFIPDGPATSLDPEANTVFFVDGPLYSTVYVHVRPQILHSVRISKREGSLLDSKSFHIENIVDIRHERNYELGMRMRTNIRSAEHTWYTDLNGFQMIKRQFFSKLPIQAHFYPMPTAAYLEDPSLRFTILSGQSLAVGSVEPGLIDVMLDRRLAQDDNRGLFQPVEDNKVTPSRFRLLLEQVHETPSVVELNPSDARMGYLSLIAHRTSLSLNHGLFALFQLETEVELNSEHLSPQPQSLIHADPWSNSFPCDVQLVNLRQIQKPDDYTAGSKVHKPDTHTYAVIHRYVYECTVGEVFTAEMYGCTPTPNTNSLSMGHLLGGDSIAADVEELTLTGLHSKRKLKRDDSLGLSPMDILTLKVKLI